jgi:large subunit ribosomal protein L4
MRSAAAVLLLLGEASGLAGGMAGSLRSQTVHRAVAPQMAAVPLSNFEGSKVGEGQVALKIAKSGAYLVQRKIVAEQANMRLGTATTKTRSDVRGGGRKPYQQKGTGRARRGSSRSPLLRGGGVTFGPKQKSYKIKMNRKEKQLAISTALMSAVPKMQLVEDFTEKFTVPRSKDMQAFLKRLDVDTTNREGTLMITKERHENTYLSARNIPYLNLLTLDNLNARDVVKAKKVVVSSSAMATIQERYGA